MGMTEEKGRRGAAGGYGTKRTTGRGMRHAPGKKKNDNGIHRQVLTQKEKKK